MQCCGSYGPTASTTADAAAAHNNQQQTACVCGPIILFRLSLAVAIWLLCPKAFQGGNEWALDRQVAIAAPACSEDGFFAEQFSCTIASVSNLARLAS